MQNDPRWNVPRILLLLLTGWWLTATAVGGAAAADEEGLQALPAVPCTDNNLITLGYKYGAGANPYTLAGKCVKLHGIKAMQYFGKDKALASWNYRGQHGIVYLETEGGKELLGDSQVLLGQCVGVYTYTSVLGSQDQVPRILISP